MIRLLLAAVLALIMPVAAAAQTALTVPEGGGRLVNLPREAASLFVGDPGVASVQAVSGDAFVLGGVRPGRTTVFALDFDDRQIANYAVTVTPDDAGAVGALRQEAPGVDTRQLGDTAVIVGVADGVADALAVLAARRGLEGAGREVIDRSRLAGGTQVSLRVRFVEASRTDLLEIGVDLSAIEAGSLRVLTGIGDPAGFVIGGAANANGGLLAGAGGSAGDVNIDGLLRALERRGVVRILSEPTLTTTSGRPASFQAGGEFGFPVAQGEGVVTTEFREFGVSVEFLPVVLPSGRIALEVAPEVSFLDERGGVTTGDFTAPALSVRRASTTVEVGSGQTFAIAGLYEQTSADTDRGVPGTRTGPFSTLFGSRSQRREERELVIFITPFIAEASDATTARPRTVPLVDTVGFIVD